MSQELDKARWGGGDTQGCGNDPRVALLEEALIAKMQFHSSLILWVFFFKEQDQMFYTSIKFP